MIVTSIGTQKVVAVHGMGIGEHLEKEVSVSTRQVEAMHNFLVCSSRRCHHAM